MTHGAMQESEDLRAVYRKVSWRILPFLLICYVFAYLDRVNVGFAKLQMQSDLALSNAAFGLGAGIFFIGYALFEIPSNLLLTKVGARRTFARILILWGLTSAAMMFVTTEWHFYLLRFLLGVFEAGFAPGMVYYLTCWFPQRRLARVMAIVMAAAPLAGLLGAPVSVLIMEHLAGWHGLKGWQWMFVLEALPCVVLGLLCTRVIADRPADANWLSPREMQWLAADVTPKSHTHHSFGSVARDPRVYLMAAAYFCIICGIYAVSFWLPSILKDNGLTSLMDIGMYSALPYLGAIVAMYLFSQSSDRRGERRWHSAVPALVAAAMLLVAANTPGHFAVSFTAITVATAMIWASYTVFWAIPSQYMQGESSAGGIALINTIGLIGGFVSPTVVGWLRDLTGSPTSALFFMSGMLCVGFVLLGANKAPVRAAI